MTIDSKLANITGPIVRG